MKKVIAQLLVISILYLGFSSVTFNASAENTSVYGNLKANSVLTAAEGRIQDILHSETTIKKGDKFIQGETYTRKAYYVSNHGNDKRNGLTPETAWATLEKVRKAKLQPGDAVFFERDGVYRGWLQCKKGVTYTAYGTGRKPILTNSPENSADPQKWVLFATGENGQKIWTYYKKIADCGNIVLNNGENCGIKYVAIWKNGEFTNDRNEKFDPVRDLKKDLMFFSPADKKLNENLPIDLNNPKYENSTGILYLRCDAGNPGSVFSSIDLAIARFAGTAIVMLKSDSVVDNLYIYCGGNCGFMTEQSKNVRVQNCEVAWNGGALLCYDDNGVGWRVGDGLCVDGSGLTIENCYIHDNNDNGITIECGYGGYFSTISDITVDRCLIDRNMNSIQIACFNDNMESEGIIYHNFVISNNYLMSTGKYWAVDQHGGDWWPNSVCLGDTNIYNDGIYVTNNTMYCAHVWGSTKKEYLPIFDGNKFYVESDDPDNFHSATAVWNYTGAINGFITYTRDNFDEFFNSGLGKDNTFTYVRDIK